MQEFKIFSHSSKWAIQNEYDFYLPELGKLYLVMSTMEMGQRVSTRVFALCTAGSDSELENFQE